MIKSIKNHYHIFRGMNKKDENGKTQLHKASEQGDVNTVKYFVDKGADMNIKDSNGYTALHLSVRKGHTDVIKALIDKENVELMFKIIKATHRFAWPLIMVKEKLLSYL